MIQSERLMKKTKFKIYNYKIDGFQLIHPNNYRSWDTSPPHILSCFSLFHIHVMTAVVALHDKAEAQ